MIVDCIADLHGFEPKLPGGDVLILAGDYTSHGKLTQWANFFHWLRKQDYDKKILIAGNHDNLFESAFPKTLKDTFILEQAINFLDTDVHFEYLCDSKTTHGALTLWGSPWTPWFDGVNPKCKSFMKSESFLEKKFVLIPKNIDILITHGPMLNILDTNLDGYACGSSSLRDAIDRVKPRFHVFGHIHEQGNNQLMYKHSRSNTWCVNCSYVDENYKPVFGHVRLEI